MTIGLQREDKCLNAPGMDRSLCLGLLVAALLYGVMCRYATAESAATAALAPAEYQPVNRFQTSLPATEERFEAIRPGANEPPRVAVTPAPPATTTTAANPTGILSDRPLSLGVPQTIDQTASQPRHPASRLGRPAPAMTTETTLGVAKPPTGWSTIERPTLDTEIRTTSYRDPYPGPSLRPTVGYGSRPTPHRSFQDGVWETPGIENGLLPNDDFLSHDNNTGINLRPWSIDYIFLSRAEVDGPSDDVLMNEFGFSYIFRYPLAERVLLSVRPIGSILFLSGPAGAGGLNLPEQLYQVALDLQADYSFNDVLGLSIGFTPGFWTDFRRVTGDDLRYPVRLLATYRPSDTLFLAAGVIYTDNFQSNLLPAVGMIWNATDRTTLEILPPRSRLIYNLHEALDLYLGLSYNSNTYNIRTEVGEEDFQYRDIRLFAGSEFRSYQGPALFLELGATVFRRFRTELQEQFNLDEAFYLRVGTRF